MRTIAAWWRQVSEFWFYRHEPEYAMNLAFAYWSALLMIAFLFVLGVLIYGGTQLASLFLGSKSSEAALIHGSGAVLLNRKELDATLQAFEVRKERYEFLKSNPPKITDPSK